MMLGNSIFWYGVAYGIFITISGFGWNLITGYRPKFRWSPIIAGIVMAVIVAIFASSLEG